jgi:hypothetical protein
VHKSIHNQVEKRKRFVAGCEEDCYHVAGVVRTSQALTSFLVAAAHALEMQPIYRLLQRRHPLRPASLRRTSAHIVMAERKNRMRAMPEVAGR